ncbi:DEAD/DEAH box helicase [Bacillus sp. REN10]|uniref:DEAD/DEAH box helicase n=1 Tax=Bacillus sp. REN10 TaxID=2782541 RepID=UPI00193C429A|nr:DEAD/DEAH box helicase [Bacillus sp. REN10]
MTKRIDVYEKAVKLTKNKIREDINQYLGREEIPPTFQQYLRERGTFVEQIWINVWVSQASNEMSRKEKRNYLTEKGIAVEVGNRKLVNQLFRTEIRNYQPFDVINWLQHKFQKEETWSATYEKARAAYLKQQEKLLQKRKQQKLLQQMKTVIESILDEQRDRLYLNFRYLFAKQLAEDLQKTKYNLVELYPFEYELVEDGHFDPGKYSSLGEFSYECTGQFQRTFDWGREEIEYETYNDRYIEFFEHEWMDQAVEMLIIELPASIYADYEAAFQQPLTKEELMDDYDHLLVDSGTLVFDQLSQEHVPDLLSIADLPFDEDIHQQIYEWHVREREAREAFERAEIERKKAEEERLLSELFGQEYQPSVERNVRYVLHIGETNTGKTHQALKRMKEASSGLYLAPLRLLALEVYDKLNKEGIPCSLKTGEEEKSEPFARHASCTVEMFHEKDVYDLIVIDEAQMLADKDRGFSWYKAITKANAKEVHIIGSKNIKEMLIQLLGESEYELIEYERELPLQVEPKPFKLSQVEPGDALVCFSRREVLETAASLKRNKHLVSMIYGSMPPETRKKQMQQFINGETNIIVSTDAIGMGVNLPIRRIVFLKNEKFDGTRRRRLTSQEVKQIAGRAGRKGMYPVGKVAFTSDIKKMVSLLEKQDTPVSSFAIAPTPSVFDRFQMYDRHLGTFFELWEKFKSPKGTKKSALTQEKELYSLVVGSDIEARLSMTDLYSFLHLPFSTKDAGLTKQWLMTMKAIVEGAELPEPKWTPNSLEELELAYKAIGLHLLFLYKLNKPTEAIYWERMREEISEQVHEKLQTEVKNIHKTCRKCQRRLPADFRFPICDSCHQSRQEQYWGRW